MNRKLVAQELRYSIENARTSSFNVRLPKASWLDLLGLLESAIGRTSEQQSDQLTHERQERARLEGLVDQLRLDLGMAREDLQRLRRQAREARRAAEELREERQRKPDHVAALAAGTRADSGEDPIMLAALYGWTSAAEMASAIVAARQVERQRLGNEP